MSRALHFHAERLAAGMSSLTPILSLASAMQRLVGLGENFDEYETRLYRLLLCSVLHS